MLTSPSPPRGFPAWPGTCAAGAKALVKLQAPQADELGFAKQLVEQEIGGTKCIVLQQDSSLGNISTVVLRGSTDQVQAAPRLSVPSLACPPWPPLHA